MRVMLDARTAGREFSGVGTYVLELVRAYAALDVDAEFLLVVAPSSALRNLRLDGRFRLIETRVSHESHPWGDLWEECVLPRRARAHRVDVLHGPAFLVPTRRLPAATVVTVHDLVAFAYPESMPRKYAMYMQWLLPRVVRAASRVITDSESVRAHVAEALGADHGRVDVVPLGVSERFRAPAPDARERTLARLALPRPYLLFVADLQPRKNLPGLLAAFRRVRREHAGIHLVVAGKAAWRSRMLRAELDAPDLEGAVHTAGYVDSADLPALYAGAEAFAFPSFWEGFGLPVLEAMACGTPVVASGVASIPEVAGDAAILVDPASPESIARGILDVLASPELRADLVRRGLDRARAFPWERTARETLASYRRALEDPRR